MRNRQAMGNRQAMRLPSGSVKVAKNELLAELRKNAAHHNRLHEEATEGYIEEALVALADRRASVNKAIEQARVLLESGEPIPLSFDVDLYFPINPPESHARDYRQIIRMVEMSEEDPITLSSEEFACYVMDDWESSSMPRKKSPL